MVIATLRFGCGCTTFYLFPSPPADEGVCPEHGPQPIEVLDDPA